MTIIDKARDRAITALGGVTPAQAERRASRAMAAGFDDGRQTEAYNDSGEDEPISGTVKRQGYKSLTRGALRDMGGLSHEEVLKAAWALYLSNPVASRALRIKRDYILGRGIQATTEDTTLQETIDAFMTDNKLDARLKKFVLQLHLLGSQIYPVFVRATDGRVRLGYIDPSQVERVITHPENVMEKWAVVIKESQGGADAWVEAQKKRVYRIVRQQDDVVDGDQVRKSKHLGLRVTAEQAELEGWEAAMLKEHGLEQYTGSCLYFSVNELSNQEQGISDLLQEADWLDQLDAALFALADREHMADYFAFDLTVIGADEAKVKERSNYFRQNPPKKGSVYVHNDKEVLQMFRPDLKQSGSIEASRTIQRAALGGLGMPEFWFGYGNETNRATAQESGTPTFRMMEADQDNARDMILEILYFVRDQALIAGREIADDAEIELSMPEMTSRDMGATAQSLQQVSQALIAVDSLDLMTRETSARIWAKFVEVAGIEYDPVEELKEVDKEIEKDELNQADQTNQAWQMALNGGNGNQPPPGQTPPQLAPFVAATKGMGGEG